MSDPTPDKPLKLLRKKRFRVEGLDYAKNPKIDRVLFICGLHRSGTTLLEHLLVQQAEIAHLRATVPESEGQHLQRVYKPARAYGGPGKFAFSQEMRQDLEHLSDHAQCRADILANWRRFTIGDAPVLLEKSPPNLTKINWLRSVFPHSRFIIVMRDPRAVASATQKWAKTSISELVRHWDVAYQLAMDQFRKEDCMVLRYEDLCDQPEHWVERVIEFAGIPARKGVGARDARFEDIANSNAKYLIEHEGISYGRGIWDKFGYM